MFTTPPRFTVVCCWGLAATLILSYPLIIQIYNHCRLMMFAPLQISSRNHVKPHPDCSTHPVADGLRVDDFWLTSGISDSVHYPPSIHSCVLLGSSCHADTVVPADYPKLPPLSSSHDVCTSSNLIKKSCQAPPRLFNSSCCRWFTC